MTKKIVSFGDSFILGSEIPNNEHGDLAWPGLISDRLGVDYTTCAVAGCGNEAIAQQIYTYFHQHDKINTLAVINWTWSMRWDFHIKDRDVWVTLGPTCVPQKLFQHVDSEQAEKLINFYKTYTGESDMWNRYRSLQAIFSAQKFLETQNIPSIQTFMDTNLFCKHNNGDRLDHYRAFADPNWPTVSTISDLELLPESIRNELDADYNQKIVPGYVEILQDLVSPSMQTFEGQTFLEWSRSHGYPVTPAPGDHPLEQAHQHAAEIWIDHYQACLEKIGN